MVHLINKEHLSSRITAQTLLTLLAWRTEPEIDTERQKFLAGRLAIIPDMQRSMYPFKGVKLTRADIEWLLVTHEDRRGPVDWNDPPQKSRLGLDLRGADLRWVDLRNLPLTRMRSGLTREEWNLTTLEQRSMAAVHLQGANLSEAHLEGAVPQGAHLDSATLRGTHREEANLFRTYLKDANLRGTHLGEAKLRGSYMEGAYLPDALLQGADLRNIFFDNASNLERITLSKEKPGCALLADVQWGSVNLSTVNWLHIKILGDEYKVRQRKRSLPARTAREKSKLLAGYHEAVQAYCQLANTMRAQGMNEEAVHFAYRAQKLQRKVLWRQVVWGTAETGPLQAGRQNGRLEQIQVVRWRVLKLGASIFSWFLDVLAGYGYKPGRSLCIYLFMIVGFTVCYLAFGHLSPREALIFSITAFHRRGFFPGPFALSDPVVAIAALEAAVGLFIEISFSAIFTQRFYGR